MATRGKTTSGHFGRLNAFVDYGWLAALSPGEGRLWLAYEKHANPAGEACPSMATLARMIGHKNTNHVPRLQRSLVAKGLIEVVETGGGRRHPSVIRVLMPGAVPDRKRSHKHSQGGSVSRPETLPYGEEKHSHMGRETLPYGEVAHKEEQPNEQPTEQPNARAAGADDDEVEELRAFFGGEPAAAGPPLSPDAERYAALVEPWMQLALASHLRSPPFYAAFGEWLAHIRERTGRNVGVVGLRRQMAKLGGMSLERAVATIEHSLTGMWTSLHEPKPQAGHGGNGTGRTTREEAQLAAIQRAFRDED